MTGTSLSLIGGSGGGGGGAGGTGIGNGSSVDMFRLFYRRFSEKIFYSTFSTTPEFSLHDVTSSSSNESINSGTEEILDNFTREFRKNRIEINRFQRIFLSMGSSVASLVNPRRHDMISCLGETTGAIALENLLQIMKENPEGQKILQDKPRINTNTIDLIKLRELPENTFGRAYVQFLDKNEVTPDSRMEVKFMDDPDLAYVMTRYRECHDLVHAILGMPTNMLGEVAVKWVEALNTGLPMCYGAAIFGAIRLRTKQRQKYRKIYLPWAIQNGRNVKPLISIYWEKRWEQDIMELRKELNITTLDLKDSI